jgi:hypothetical protein
MIKKHSFLFSRHPYESLLQSGTLNEIFDLRTLSLKAFMAHRLDHFGIGLQGLMDFLRSTGFGSLKGVELRVADQAEKVRNKPIPGNLKQTIDHLDVKVKATISIFRSQFYFQPPTYF